MYAGRSGTTASSCSRVGRPPGKDPYSQPRPSTQGRPGSDEAKALIRLWTAASVWSSIRSTRSSESAPPARWMCPSLKPGVTRRPLRGRTCVAFPRSASAPRASPAKAMRLPRIASASTQGRAGSAVQIRPPVKIRSAGASAPRAVETPSAATTSHSPAPAFIAAPWKARILVQRLYFAMPQPSVRAILLASCHDQRGIVATVSDFVYRHGGNILDFDQHTDLDDGTFLQRLSWDLDGFGIPRDGIVEAFRSIADRFGMAFEVRFSDHVPRLAIFVSKLDHCLFDLLWRHRIGELRAALPFVISHNPDLRGVA